MIRSEKAQEMRSTQEIRKLGGWLMRSNLRQLIYERQAREGQKITGRDISVATGIQEATISRWMSDRPMSTIHGNVLGELMKFGGWSVDELITIEAVGAGVEEPA